MHRNGDVGRWAVETHGLTKRFGPKAAVNGVELLVPRGSAFGYLGPNGAGKTTLIRVLLGLTRADAGTMSLLGYPVPRHRDVALARVGAIVDEPRFHRHLTGRQNLRLLAAAREPAARDRIGPSLDRVGLARRADERVLGYSMGMRQRLGVAACLLSDPELLILDEPMNGLDPAGMADMRELILSMVADGRTVVLSSHLLDEIERTCDAVAIVDHGSVIRQGPIAELLAGAQPSSPARHSVPASRPYHRRWGWPSRCPWARAATSSPRSTASWSKAESPSTACSRSRPRSNRGSCRSRPGWGTRNDGHARPSAGRAEPGTPAGGQRFRTRPPGIPGSHRRHDRHQNHGAA
jgi:ABC-type multidrug transport system ATPase subunit